MQRRPDWDVLMHAAVSGDAKSYKTLLEVLPGVLRSVTRRGYARFGVEPNDVEDVVQEVLLAIHLKRHTWKVGAPVAPWVMAIARHKLIDALRRRGRQVHIPLESVVDVLEAEAPETQPDRQTDLHDVKFVVTAVLLIPAALLTAHLARPDATPGLWGWALLIAPLLLVASVSAELVASPINVWTAKLIGTNAVACVTLIVLLSTLPFAALFFALSQGAPAEPGLAGAVAGITAGALAATLYAMHCTDDSPLFVATWYTIGIGIMARAGNVLGERLLRW